LQKAISVGLLDNNEIVHSTNTIYKCKLEKKVPVMSLSASATEAKQPSGIFLVCFFSSPASCPRE